MNGVNHMNEKNRVFGNNVKLFISDKNLSEQTVAEHLGYSKYDLQQQAETLFSDFTQVNLYVYLD